MTNRNRRKWQFMKVMIALLFVAQSSLAENKLTVVERDEHSVKIRLRNTDPIAGIQFAIRGRGISLKTFDATDRTISSGLSVHQYLKDARTLNVIILAPVRSDLPAGDGFIGNITFELIRFGSTDTCEISLTAVEICNQNAIALDVTVVPFAWRDDDVRGDQRPDFALRQNFPNPFNPSTTIIYTIDHASQVVLSVYDITGRQIEMLVDRFQAAGTYQARWIAEGELGRRLSSGVYIARLQVDGRVSARAMNYTK